MSDLTHILRHPKEVSVSCQDGTTRSYIISKLPATVGFKLVTQVPLTAAPKIGDFEKNEALIFELFGFIAARKDNGEHELLRTRALIDNHVPDWEAYARLIKEMAEYNISFFPKGKPSDLLANLVQKAVLKITPMLIPLLQSLSQNDSQHSKS